MGKVGIEASKMFRKAPKSRPKINAENIFRQNGNWVNKLVHMKLKYICRVLTSQITLAIIRTGVHVCSLNHLRQIYLFAICNLQNINLPIRTPKYFSERINYNVLLMMILIPCFVWPTYSLFSIFHYLLSAICFYYFGFFFSGYCWNEWIFALSRSSYS